MPHIQIELNQSLSDSQKIAMAGEVKALFVRVMDTDTDHIGTSLREYGTYSLDLGRVADHSLGVALANIDLRQGRTLQ